MKTLDFGERENEIKDIRGVAAQLLGVAYKTVPREDIGSGFERRGVDVLELPCSRSFILNMMEKEREERLGERK